MLTLWHLRTGQDSTHHAPGWQHQCTFDGQLQGGWGGVNFNPGAKHIQAQGKAASMWKGETEFTTPTWSHIFILYWGPQSTCFLRSYFMNINCWCSQGINRTILHLCYDNR